IGRPLGPEHPLDLHRDVAPDAVVAAEVHLAHPSLADEVEALIARGEVLVEGRAGGGGSGAGLGSHGVSLGPAGHVRTAWAEIAIDCIRGHRADDMMVKWSRWSLARH